MRPMKGGSIRYMPCLDGLRTVAIGMVLFEHFGGYLVNFCSTGYYGVDLFLVISGYLITSILLKDRQESFTGSYRIFMGRRMLRIFPLYYAVIAFVLLINFGEARELWGWLITYTFNYGVIGWREQMGQTPLFYLWSLSLEEQFYLFWPFIAISLRKRPRVLIAVTLPIVLIGFLQITHNIIPQISQYNYTGLINRMGSLGLGALAAVYFTHWKAPAWIFRNRLVEAMVLIGLGVTLGAGHFTYSPVLLALISLYLVIKASLFQFYLPGVQRILTNRFIVWVGSISYGIYLLHMPLAHVVTVYIFDPIWMRIPFQQFGSLAVLEYHSWILKLPLYSGLAIVVAGLSFRYFESPILRLKERWFCYPQKNKGAVESVDPVSERASDAV